MILVSLDGMRPETYTEPDARGLRVPTLRRMAKEGAASAGLRSVMPTVTYPSHTSMVTGVDPARHGIATNLAADPSGRNLGGWRWYASDIRAPTLWQAARARGLRTALVFWPVTVGAAADFLVPEYWRAKNAEDWKLLAALSTPGAFVETARRFPAFPADADGIDKSDVARTDLACAAIAAVKPDLLLLHLAQIDHEEHSHGPFSPEANAAAELDDAQIARLIAASKAAGLWDSTALVVVSDHGFAPISANVRLGVLLRRAGFPAPDASGPLVLASGGSAYVYADGDAARARLRKLLAPLAGKAGGGILRVAEPRQIAALGGDPGAALALDAADGYQFVDGDDGAAISPARGGTHGYFPDRPEMRASLLVYGPAIAAGGIADARMIDLAPTIGGWLGVSLPAQGRRLTIPLKK